MGNQWLLSRTFDLLFIISPSFFAVIFVLCFSNQLTNLTEIPTWGWVVLILGIDVSHVYSSLFRTYFHKKEFFKNKTLFTLVPSISFIFGILIYSFNALYFWRLLAYLAVFHFIRQQYGFMRLYSRKESLSPWSRGIDSLLIYMTMVFPIAYWHTHLPRNFQWFIYGDFIRGIPQILTSLLLFFYCFCILIYIIKEIFHTIKTLSFNLPKNLIILGTALSWYVGIVFTNDDLSFTITNVITHGIPYIALVWLFGFRESHKEEKLIAFANIDYKYFFSRQTIPLFFFLLLLLAYLEEGLWAGIVWRERLEFFNLFAWLPEIQNHDTLSLIVPLLTLPQLTHYILDGFIWKITDCEQSRNSLLG